jgi:Ala-tRNA(Pro) deacylase
MISERFQRLLEAHPVPHEVIPHPETFTATGVARATHVPDRCVAKVVVMRSESRRDFMVVLPASQQVDTKMVQRVSGRPGARLEDEAELRRLFPDCEVGAMPPIGALYGMTTHVDPCLCESEHIWFQAGNHHELVRMRFEDYERIAGALVCDVCLHHEAPVSAG